MSILLLLVALPSRKGSTLNTLKPESVPQAKQPLSWLNPTYNKSFSCSPYRPIEGDPCVEESGVVESRKRVTGKETQTGTNAKRSQVNSRKERDYIPFSTNSEQQGLDED